MSSEQTDCAKPRRRWLSFSVRGLLIGMTLVCLLLGWLGRHYVQMIEENAIVDEVMQSGGQVYYDYHKRSQQLGEPQDPAGPKWLRDLLGEHLFSRVEAVEIFAQTENAEEAAADVVRLKGLTHLKRVALGNIPLEDPQIEVLRRMREVRLMRGQISAEQFAKLAQSPSLQAVWLRVEAMDDRLLASLPTFANLQELNLSFLNGRYDEHSITRQGMQSIGAMPHLRRLRLEALPDEGLRHFDQLKSLTQLEALAIEYVPIKDDHFTTISQFTCLKHLSIRPDFQSTFRDEGFTKLQALKQLETLELPQARIGDRSMRTIARLPQLRELSIRGTWITDTGLAELKDHQSLEALDLRETRVTDRGLLPLNNVATFRRLWIRPDWGDAVTMDCLVEMRFLTPTQAKTDHSMYFVRNRPKENSP